MGEFILKSDFKPTGDQPDAIKKIAEGLEKNYKYQTLLGVTGSGKTFTMANIIEKIQNQPWFWLITKPWQLSYAQNSKNFFLTML